jgi:hypothetical protein
MAHKFIFRDAEDALEFLIRLESQFGELYRDKGRGEEARVVKEVFDNYDPKAAAERLVASRGHERDPAADFEDDIIDFLTDVRQDIGALYPDVDWPAETWIWADAAKKYGAETCNDLARDGILEQLLGMDSAIVRSLMDEHAEKLDALSAGDVLVGFRRFGYVLENVLTTLHAGHEVTREDIDLAIRWHGDKVLRATIAWHYIWPHACTIARAVDRTLNLAKRALPAVPSGPVPRYLGMLQRCYAAGYYAECHMICRSALENAMRHAFRRARVSPEDTMNKNVGIALQLGWLTPTQAGAARSIWQRGNKAIHDGVLPIADPIEQIVSLLDVVYALENVGLAEAR